MCTNPEPSTRVLLLRRMPKKELRVTKIIMSPPEPSPAAPLLAAWLCGGRLPEQLDDLGSATHRQPRSCGRERNCCCAGLFPAAHRSHDESTPPNLLPVRPGDKTPPGRDQLLDVPVVAPGLAALPAHLQQLLTTHTRATAITATASFWRVLVHDGACKARACLTRRSLVKYGYARISPTHNYHHLSQVATKQNLSESEAERQAARPPCR